MKNILEYLENTAKQRPNAIAAEEPERIITFYDLMRSSRSIGTRLARDGVCHSPIAVFMEKGIDALTAFFGSVYAGNYYTLINPTFPSSRIHQIQSVLCAETVITTVDLADNAEKLFPNATVYRVNELQSETADEALLYSVREHSIDTDPLYMNFTSGTTGVPKGILVAHRSVIDFIGYFTTLFSITEKDVLANQAPFDFDVSVKDIYSSLSTGARLVIVPKELFSSPRELVDYLCEKRITTMIWAVSALCLISTFHCLEYRLPSTVSKILFSGETMPYKHLKNWQQHLPDAQYVNLYGPTEITCNCTYHIMEKGRDYSGGIPIGKPFPNEDVFLLDSNDNRVLQQGEVGEITVRGTALALGYYRLTEEYEKHFTANPLNSIYPETVYRTGDLGCYNDAGEILFCGRKDHQIKHMGHRIELEEVEKEMSAIDGVERCVCLFDEKHSRMKGYYIGTIDKNELHAAMKSKLPLFMIPGYLRRLEQLPLNKNGKIDRNALKDV